MLDAEMIQGIQSQLGNILDGDLVEQVLKRLDSFGYTIQESDAWLVGFAIQKVTDQIKSECNTSGIPEGLLKVAVDMACGEFLMTKKQTGQLTIDSLDLNGAVTSIKEGDTQVNFGGTSDEEKLNLFIAYLMGTGKDVFACYRKMRW